jgi:hypothetical protein
MSENDFMDGELKSPSALLIYDRLFRYKGYHGCKSYCNLRIFLPKHPAPLYIVFTELESNPGTSVTNRIEHLATCVWRKIPQWNASKRMVHMPIDKLPIWIEHYPNRGLQNPHTKRWLIPETFAFVEIRNDNGSLAVTEDFIIKKNGWIVRPNWRHTSRMTVETVLGREFPPVRDPYSDAE